MQAHGLLVWVSASAHGRAPGKGSTLVTSSVLGPRCRYGNRFPYILKAENKGAGDGFMAAETRTFLQTRA